MIPRLLDPGRLVRVRLAGSADDWTLARIAVASEDRASIGLFLGGPVRATGGVIVGCLALLVDERRETVTDLRGDEYELEVQDDGC